SPLSETIRRAAGADDATAVGLFLATKDHRLAKTFMDEARRASTMNKYAKSVIPIWTICGGFVCALPMHLVVRRRGMRLSQTFFVLLFWGGWWAPITGIALSIGALVSFSNGALVFTFIGMMLGLFAWFMIDLVRG